jgi:hypothetical protein
MTGAIEVEISSESLFTALQNKTNELPDRLNRMGASIILAMHGHAVDEAPYITHNLQASLTWEENGLLSWRLFPNEGVAPYALYVILGHNTRPGKNQHWVEGNPFLDRASDLSEADIQSEIAELEEWLSDI